MDSLDTQKQTTDQLLHERLEFATASELVRMCGHLSLKSTAGSEEILRAYLDAADNTILSVVRSVIKSKEPTYRQILLLIYKELRSFSEGLDDTWSAVKSVKFWNYRSPVDSLSDQELEERIFKMYAAEYSDAKKKLIADPSLWKKVTSYIPGVTGVAAGTAASVGAATAMRLPFAAVAPGAVAGPIGLGVAVVTMGIQAAGPAFRKIVPATVELMLIGRRIEFMPKD